MEKPGAGTKTDSQSGIPSLGPPVDMQRMPIGIERKIRGSVSVRKLWYCSTRISLTRFGRERRVRLMKELQRQDAKPGRADLRRRLLAKMHSELWFQSAERSAGNPPADCLTKRTCAVL